MAPEVLEEKGTGSKSDVWSLGCTIIEMLNGGNPWGYMFDDSNLLQALKVISQSDILPTIEHEQEVSAECLDFLKQCLTRDYAKRPSSKELLAHPWLREEAIV